MPRSETTSESSVTPEDIAAFRRERPNLEHWTDAQITLYLSELSVYEAAAQLKRVKSA